jgi:hypothetical protein
MSDQWLEAKRTEFLARLKAAQAAIRELQGHDDDDAYFERLAIDPVARQRYENLWAEVEVVKAEIASILRDALDYKDPDTEENK